MAQPLRRRDPRPGEPRLEKLRNSSAVCLEGERTQLRSPRIADLAEYIALRKASADFLRPWEPELASGVDPHGEPRFRASLHRGRTDRQVRTLLCRRSDGRILGGLNFNEIVRGPLQSGYLGYWVGLPFARQGFMREGIQLALAHAFGELGLHRLEANICPENAASIALVRRAGFRREGYSPRYLQIAGRWRDHERWALLADDWSERCAADARAAD